MDGLPELPSEKGRGSPVLARDANLWTAGIKAAGRIHAGSGLAMESGPLGRTLSASRQTAVCPKLVMLGMVSDATGGETSYTDGRYWVDEVFDAGTEGPAGWPVLATRADGLRVLAFCLDEYVSREGQLESGDIVWVYAIEGQGADTKYLCTGPIGFGTSAP